MREGNQLKQILSILSFYKNDRSLSSFLAEYYKEHKQMGASDRRLASRFIYNFFRLGKALQNADLEERIAISSFLCEQNLFPLLEFILQKYSFLSVDKIRLSKKEKLKIIAERYSSFGLEEVFPFTHLLSDNLDKTDFFESLFSQPQLWIRVRKAHMKEVMDELDQKLIVYKIDEENTSSLSFTNATKLTELDTFRKGYFEIQDLSSQTTAHYFKAEANERWWDCCAGSGGKSLSLIDKSSTISLFVSDTRQSILKNLKERLSKVNFQNYTLAQLDLQSDFFIPNTIEFDGIIADVPCSGSGTWSRTPEMLFQFKEEALSSFHKTQLKIIESVIPFLKKNKALIYITCSIFKMENELIIDHFVHSKKLRVEIMKLIDGSKTAADTMFVARLLKN